MTFLALPRSAGAEKAHESPGLMLAPQAFLAADVRRARARPGLRARACCAGVAGSLPGVRPAPEMVRGWLRDRAGAGHFDHLSPPLVALAACSLGLALALGAVAGGAATRCGGRRPGAAAASCRRETEYTATAFSKPLMMIFGAIYRPTREVSTVETAPYFPQRGAATGRRSSRRSSATSTARSRAGVLGAAERMRVIQAGSLHAYLAYVLVLGIVLLLWLGGGR